MLRPSMPDAITGASQCCTPLSPLKGWAWGALDERGHVSAGRVRGGRRDTRTRVDVTRAASGPGWRGYLRALGPGLVTGASDDDPSGVATYGQAGAQFRYGLL